MFRLLASIAVITTFTPLASAQAFRPAIVAVLRESQPGFNGVNSKDGQLLLLNEEAKVVGEISELSICGTWTLQGQMLFDPAHQQFVVVETAGERLSFFDYTGRLKRAIEVGDPQCAAITHDSTLIGCVAGGSLNALETIFFDLETGKEVSRYKWGGTTLINDVEPPLFWSVGTQVTAFDSDGNISLRRPLSQMPPEPNAATVINASNWCATGVAIEGRNKDPHQRRIWVMERKHPDVKGSLNRLFAIEPTGRTRILVELGEVVPISIACATCRDGHSQIVVVDARTGELVSFNLDGESMEKVDLDARAVGFSERFGLWVAGTKSIKRLDPADLSVITEHTFEDEGNVIGLTVR
jgi:hypothetical protein